MGKKKKKKPNTVKNLKENREPSGSSRLKSMGIYFSPEPKIIWEEDFFSTKDIENIFPKIENTENTENITIDSTPYDDIKYHPANRFIMLKIPEFMKEDYEKIKKINGTVCNALNSFVKGGVYLSGDIDFEKVVTVTHESFGKLPLSNFINEYSHLIINREKKSNTKMNPELTRFMNLVRTIKGE